MALAAMLIVDWVNTGACVAAAALCTVSAVRLHTRRSDWVMVAFLWLCAARLAWKGLSHAQAGADYAAQAWFSSVILTLPAAWAVCRVREQRRVARIVTRTLDLAACGAAAGTGGAA